MIKEGFRRNKEEQVDYALIKKLIKFEKELKLMINNEIEKNGFESINPYCFYAYFFIKDYIMETRLFILYELGLKGQEMC